MSIQFIDFIDDSIDKNKFNSCRFKSKDKIKKNVKLTCCSKGKEVEGYNCEKRGIFPLSPKQCNDCKVYECS
jgi:hypothetical protein